MKKFFSFFLVFILFSCSKDLISYTLTATANPAEGGSVSPSSKQYDAGDVATITATPSSEYLFERWSGSASGTSPSITVTMDSDKAVVANFIKKQYPLTIEIEGEGSVTETVIKQGLATDYNSGTIVELKAVPEDGWEFIEWSGDLTGSENPKQITIDKAKTVNVKFAVKPELSIDFNNTNGMLISKAKTSSANGTSNNNYNAKLINFNGELTELVIPGSKSHTLNITRALELNEQFLLLFGNLLVEYEGDVNGDGENGDKINYNNIIIDKSTGDFYEAGAGFGGIKYTPGSGDWINHNFQYDSNGLLYYSNQEELNTNNVQVVDKMSIEANDGNLTVNREKLNVIATNTYFNYRVGYDGDIIYKSHRYNIGDEIGYRNSDGKTYILSEAGSGDDPFKYNNSSEYYYYNNDRTFVLKNMDSELIVFKQFGSDYGMGGPNFLFNYAIMKITENGEIKKELIKEFKFEPEGFPEGDLGYGYYAAKGPIYQSYGMSYFRRKIDDEMKHILINPRPQQFSDFTPGTIITVISELSNGEIEVKGIYTDEINESKYFTAIQNEAYSSNSKMVLYAFSQDIFKIDFESLSLSFLVEDSGYEFYKLAPASDEEFYFYGLSYENGKRTLGKINLEGTIEIIEQFDNDIDLLKLIKIGGTN